MRRIPKATINPWKMEIGIGEWTLIAYVVATAVWILITNSIWWPIKVVIGIVAIYACCFAKGFADQCRGLIDENLTRVRLAKKANSSVEHIREKLEQLTSHDERLKLAIKGIIDEEWNWVQ